MNRAQAATTPSLVTLLDEVATWREREGDVIDAALSLLATEEQEVRRLLDEAQRRFDALGVIRREQEERLDRLDEESVRRKRSGVRSALVHDRAFLEDRAAALGAAVARRDREAGVGLDDPAVARAVAEYLDALEHAASLRGGLVAEPEHLVSGETRSRLAPYLEAAAAPPPRLGLPRGGVGVIVSADPPTGTPEALVVVLPVPWAVYADAGNRTEDLCSWLAYRMVAAVHGLLHELGVRDAPVRYVDVQGSVGISVWLGDHVLAGDLRERTLEAISAAVESAPELEAAGVDVYAVWLTPDLLAEAAS